MRFADHPFFKILEQADKNQKMYKKVGWGSFANVVGHGDFGIANYMQHKLHFYNTLKVAHPFVFDKKVAADKTVKGRTRQDMENLVEDFSLPYKNTLYLVTDPIYVRSPIFVSKEDAQRLGISETGITVTYGYLISEITPERFIATVVSLLYIGKDPLNSEPMPCIRGLGFDLSVLRKAEWKNLAEDDAELNSFREVGCILNLTKSISVKRIGIEKLSTFTVTSRGVKAGFTSLKMENLIHVADKVDYEYVKPLSESQVRWEQSSWRRGHWRAFYLKDADGNTIKDAHGWDMVDYSRTGKNRQGERCVSGYTWVVEHIVGNPLIAEIKNHVVKSSV